MTPQEFKAWFLGFTEGLDDGLPTQIQWDRIRARVKEIDGQPITYPVYVERWKPYLEYPYIAYWGNTSTGFQWTSDTGCFVGNTYIPKDAVWCSASALYTVGKSEAISLTLS